MTKEPQPGEVDQNNQPDPRLERLIVEVSHEASPSGSLRGLESVLTWSTGLSGAALAWLMSSTDQFSEGGLLTARGWFIGAAVTLAVATFSFAILRLWLAYTLYDVNRVLTFTRRAEQAQRDLGTASPGDKMSIEKRFEDNISSASRGIKSAGPGMVWVLPLSMLAWAFFIVALAVTAAYAFYVVV